MLRQKILVAAVLTGSVLLGSACKHRAADTSSVKEIGQGSWWEYHNRTMANIEAYRKYMDALKVRAETGDIEAKTDLRREYLRAYSNYADAYRKYLVNLAKMYKRTDNLRSELMTSARMIDKFQKQSAICSARAKNLWRRNLRSANEEVWNRNISYNAIGANFRYLATKPHGEQCTRYILTELQGQLTEPSPEILLLRILNKSIPGDDGSRVGIVCPHENPGFKAPTQEGATGPVPYVANPMSYPPFEVMEKDGIKQSVFYYPSTYYQLYRLMTEPEAAFVVGPPAPAGTPPRCGVRDPSKVSNWNYYQAGVETEKLIKAQFSTGIQRGNVVPGKWQIVSGATDQHYKTLMTQLKSIYERIEACADAMDKAAGAQPPAGGGFTLDDTATDPLDAEINGTPATSAATPPAAGQPVAGAGQPQPGQPAVQPVRLTEDQKKRQAVWPPSYSDPLFVPQYLMVNGQLVSTGVGGAIGGSPVAFLQAQPGFPPSADPLAVGSFDPQFPEMDQSINRCLMIAEHYRQKAFENREAVKAVLETMNQTTDMPPPGPQPITINTLP